MPQSGPARLLGVTLAALLVLAAPAPSGAQCTLGKDAGALRKSIHLATRCNDTILRAGPGVPCRQSPPPACAGTMATDAVALGYGPNNPPTSGVDRSALRDQLTCQRRIGSALTTYVGRKMRLLQNGTPPAVAEARARRQLDLLPGKCAVVVAQDTSGVVLPAVGPQCAAAIGAPGTVVDAAAL